MPKKKALSRRGADVTRAAILAAARDHFAKLGYERATVRAIAADAQIDPALVIRYFGSKEDLFAEAADFDLRLPDLATSRSGRMGDGLVEHFMTRWEEDDTFLALLRTAVTHEDAARRIRDVFAEQVMPVIAALSVDPAGRGTRAGLVASQILGMALCRYVLKLPPVVAMTRAEVVAWLGPTVQRYMTGDVE
jgi:AcrR family transcriptional regulator